MRPEKIPEKYSAIVSKGTACPVCSISDARPSSAQVRPLFHLALAGCELFYGRGGYYAIELLLFQILRAGVL
eukprot:1818421-Pyramimonas_sp.AAC.1